MLALLLGAACSSAGWSPLQCRGVSPRLALCAQGRKERGWSEVLKAPVALSHQGRPQLGLALLWSVRHFEGPVSSPSLSAFTGARAACACAKTESQCQCIGMRCRHLWCCTAHEGQNTARFVGGGSGCASLCAPPITAHCGTFLAVLWNPFYVTSANAEWGFAGWHLQSPRQAVSPYRNSPTLRGSSLPKVALCVLQMPAMCEEVCLWHLGAVQLVGLALAPLVLLRHSCAPRMPEPDMLITRHVSRTYQQLYVCLMCWDTLCKQ